MQVALQIGQISFLPEARPIFKPHQNHIQTVSIARQQARIIEQLHENLVVGSEADLMMEAHLSDPVRQRFFERRGCERGADCDRGHWFLSSRDSWESLINLRR